MAFFEEQTWHALVAFAALLVLVMLTLLSLDLYFGEGRWVPVLGLLAGAVVATDVVVRARARRA